MSRKINPGDSYPSFHRVSVSLLMRENPCHFLCDSWPRCLLCFPSVCQDHQRAPGSWSWGGSAPTVTNTATKTEQEGVCLCLLKPELPFFLCRSHGWLLQQAADGVWHRDSHRPPELRDRTGAGEEIQLKPSSNVEPLQHFAISNQESGLCLKENVGFFVGFLLVFFFLNSENKQLAILVSATQPVCLAVLHSFWDLFLNQVKQYFLSRQFIFLPIYIYVCVKNIA